MNGITALPKKAWKTECVKLTAELRRLDGNYADLKSEIKEAEQVRRNIHGILRQEQQA